MFKESYKEKKVSGILPEFTEHIDSTTNIYANFLYNVAFDAPDNWEIDSGINEHTIFRAYEPDSAITFLINVIEPNISKEDSLRDIWDFYKNNTSEMDQQLRDSYELQVGVKLENFKTSRSFIKNQSCLKTTFTHKVRDLDFEYDNTSILYQTFKDNYTYTFGLHVPTMFYDENPDYYESLMANIYFVNNRELMNRLINQKKSNDK